MPDSSPYGIILGVIGQSLVEANHEVEVFTSKPSYKTKKKATKTEKLNGMRVRRLSIFQENKKNILTRILNVLIYCFGLFTYILRQKPDVVSAGSFPPVFAAWTASLGAKWIGAKFIYHIQDIHPEVSVVSSDNSKVGVYSKILTFFDNQTLRRASKIVTLSFDMKATLLERGQLGIEVDVIENLQLEDFYNQGELPKKWQKATGKTRIIFAGNIGRFQNLELLSEGISHCFTKHPDLELFFLGDGVAKNALRKQWKDNPQVKFAPYLPYAQAKLLISEADIGLVSLSPNLFKVAYPSKIINYLNLGIPIFALVEPESQIARDVRDANVGSVPTSDDVEDIGIAIEGLLQKIVDGDISDNLTASFASNEDILQRWNKLILELETHI